MPLQPSIEPEHKNSKTSNKNDQLKVTEELQHVRYELNNLYLVNELSQKITASLSLDDSFHHLYNAINSMMDAAVMQLDVRYGEKNTRLYYSNLKQVNTPNNDLPVNHMAEWCFENNKAMFLPNAEDDYERYVYKPLQLENGKIARSLICFPISNNLKVIGTLTVISFVKNAFEPFHQEMVGQLIPFIAVAIKNAYHHQELNVLKQRAENSEEFMQQFLANMSHEIRTPIHAITGMTQLLLDKDPLDEQIRYLQSIRNASETLLVIINDILDLSKIEAKKLELEKIDFSVSDVVNHIQDMMQLKAEEKGLQLITHIDSAIAPVLKGDPVRLTQILINLVGNAIKFTNKGQVKLSADLYHDKTRPEKTDGVNEIFFSVYDTGIGMTEDQQRKLFQKYTQASPEITRKYGGTGLGLSIANQLVHLHGGKMGASSKMGEGSTFYFNIKFPISENDSIKKQTAVVTDEMINKLEGLRVLITDDNEYNRTVATESLIMKLKNVVVDEAADGITALNMLRKNKYDVVLMDLVMIKLDGFETTHKIRTELPAPASEVAVIALTASAVQPEMDKCIEAGMNGFLAKPFKTDQLIKILYDVLHGNGGFDVSTVHRGKGTKYIVGKVVDLNQLDEHMDGDIERMSRHLERFKKQIPASLRSLRSFIENEDHENARVVSHSMKPLLGVLGAEKGYGISANIEHLCIKKSKTEELLRHFLELESVCNEALEEVQNISLVQDTD